MLWLVPIIAGILYRAGGTDQWEWCPVNQKLWRWLMGIPIAIVGLLSGVGPVALWAVLTYYIAVNIPYGETSPLSLLGEPLKFTVCGFCVGAASYPILGLWAILQAVVGGLGFLLIWYLDEKDIVKNPFVEILRGVVATIVFLGASWIMG